MASESSADSFALEQVPNSLSSLIDDLIPVLVDDLGANLLKATYVPVDGTEYSRLVFEIDRAALYTNLQIALRARGFDTREWDQRIIGHDVRS